MAAARRYLVSGRVQGVAFRAFVQHWAVELGLSGYARNLDDGRVEVYAAGRGERLKELEARLWRGPLLARVESVQAEDADLLQYQGFRIMD
jgi:acylphosphatase